MDESGEIVLESMSKWCPDRMSSLASIQCIGERMKVAVPGGRQMEQMGLIRTWSLESGNNVIVVAVDQRRGG